MDIDDRPLNSLGRRQAKPSALAKRYKPQILEAICQGRPLQAIAQELGYTSNAAIINRIGTHEDFRQALSIGAEARLETREIELEGANDNVSVSRARELLSHARWRAERLNSMYAAKPQFQVNVDNRSVTVQPVLDKLLAALHKSVPALADQGDTRAIDVMSSTSAPEQCDTDKNES